MMSIIDAEVSKVLWDESFILHKSFVVNNALILASRMTLSRLALNAGGHFSGCLNQHFEVRCLVSPRLLLRGNVQVAVGFLQSFEVCPGWPQLVQLRSTLGRVVDGVALGDE